jgi:hypothetical protein
MFVGAKHDRSEYGMITNNLYAVLLRPPQKPDAPRCADFVCIEAVSTAEYYQQLNIKIRIINNFANLLVHIISSHIPRNQLSQNSQRNQLHRQNCTQNPKK